MLEDGFMFYILYPSLKLIDSQTIMERGDLSAAMFDLYQNVRGEVHKDATFQQDGVFLSPHFAHTGRS